MSSPGRHGSTLLFVLTVVANTAWAQDTSFFEPYICTDDANWANWDVDKKTWCCAEKKMGCSPPSTLAPISFPATSSQPYSPPLSPGPADPAPVDPAPVSSACSTPCVVNGISHTCSERVLWSASHTFQLQVAPCAMAMDLVLGQCPHCQACKVNNVGCQVADTPTAAPTALPPTTLPSTTLTTTTPTTSTLPPTTTTVAIVHTTQKLIPPRTSRIPPPSLGFNREQLKREAEKIAAVLKTERAKLQAHEHQKEMALAAKEAALDEMVAKMKAKEEKIEREKARIAEQAQMLKDAQAEAEFHAQQMAGVASPGLSSPSAAERASAPQEHEEGPSSANRGREESSSGPPFECHADSLDDMDSWKEDRKVWCCKHKDRACDLIRSNSAAKKTQNSATPYHCQGEEAGPIDEWSDVKLKWCCSVHTVGCHVHRHHESSKHSPSGEEPEEKDHHEKKEDEQPHHKESKGFFEGHWTDKRGNSLVISDSTISWPDTKRSAKITRQSEKGISMAFGGGEYHAKYIDAKLVWDVDDVWTPSSQGHSEEHHSKEAPKENHEEDDFQVKIRTVLSTVDRNHNGHVDFTEITSLQRAANVGQIQRETYEQLCKKFGEDPSVGLGMETLTSIYSKSGALPGAESSGMHAAKKFLSGQGRVTFSSAASLATLFACAVSCVVLALTGASLLSRAATSSGRALQVSRAEEDDGDAQHYVTYRVVPSPSSPSSALLVKGQADGL